MEKHRCSRSNATIKNLHRLVHNHCPIFQIRTVDLAVCFCCWLTWLLAWFFEEWCRRLVSRRT
jgi:hypothetical protein